jgi:hypothetical protein
LQAIINKAPIVIARVLSISTTGSTGSCGKSSVEGDGRVVGVATLEPQELSTWGMVVGGRDVLAVRCPADASFGLSNFRAMVN